MAMHSVHSHVAYTVHTADPGTPSYEIGSRLSNNWKSSLVLLHDHWIYKSYLCGVRLVQTCNKARPSQTFLHGLYEEPR
jgi:hypothetical protein